MDNRLVNYPAIIYFFTRWSIFYSKYVILLHLGVCYTSLIWSTLKKLDKRWRVTEKFQLIINW